MAKSKLRLAVAKKVQVVPLTPYVLPTIVSWAEKPENAEFFRRTPPLSEWCEPERSLRLWQSANTQVVFEDLTPVGVLVMVKNDQNSRSCEVGVLIDKESSAHRHQTFMLALHQMLANIFDYHNLHKVVVRVLTHRTELRKTLESIGATCEATLRDSIFYQGEYQDEWYISLLKLEYRRPT